MTGISIEAIDLASKFVLNNVFNLTEKGPFDKKFNILGFEDCNFILAMNGDLKVIIFILLTFVTASVIIKIAKKKHTVPICSKLGAKLHSRKSNQIVSRIMQIGFVNILTICMISKMKIGNS